MTREEARREIDSLDYYLQNHTNDYGEESHTAMMMAIKALEQEPCEDTISRQSAIEEFQKFREYESNRTHKEWVDRIETVLNQLPSVRPQEKTGHWVLRDDKCKCSNCKDISPVLHNYCPNCGVKMKRVE